MWDSTHPEVPDRIQRPYDKLKEYGLLERCQEITSRFVSDEELLSQHSTVHVNKMKSSKTLTTEELYHMGACDYDSVYMSQHACECACLASGCTLAATEAVVTDKVQNAVAIVRPPGHHGGSDFAMGYCFFNNVAIAARMAQKRWNVERILIVDWDIHHGNGTQHLFESDPSVLYLSIHRFDNALFFPFSMEADYDFVGCGSGKGYTVNVLWNKVSLCNICTFSSSEKPVVAIVKKRAQNKAKHMGDADYLAVFHHILLPIAYEFDPELVLVSAGFDSARGDPKGQCDVTPEGYHHLTKLLMNLARGKIVVVLEGGYNLTSVEESICACTSLLGDPCPRLEGPLTPCNSF
ncbi:polyamine deacetylase HDAC10-like isoform X2 [Acropora millepora]|uniref:polyamine deacetylase HDAC10-like isoform X2 n=1 Tax=Acropora millepora TaxID=45264 RepID=UPI001CF54E32|nr:polyamine deacetylase HDAC10-like isoform X2 [Acropora millepora]